MAKKPILTAPDHESTAWPKGIPYIIGNEACERFSFYGMKAILQPHLAYLYAAMGVGAAAAEQQGSHDVHMFIASAYALPMVGAIIADKWLGKYLTIMSLSLIYCLGHLVLAIGENSLGGMHLGLALIALGTGGIKPCVSAHVGDQFGKNNWHLSKKAFQFFYFSVNFGSFFSTLLIPWMRNEFGATVAFGLPGILMFLATIVFWWGRWSFVHIPGRPGGSTGLLDAASGVFLFIGFLGGWLFGPELGLGTVGIIAVSVPSVIIGFALFALRQKRTPDDGFLAVFVPTIASGITRSLGALVKPRGFGSEPIGAAAILVGVFLHEILSGVGAAGFEATLRTLGIFKLIQLIFVAGGIVAILVPVMSRGLPAGTEKKGEAATEGMSAVFRVLSVIVPVSVFWALFDQHGTTWLTQAKGMDLDVFGLFTLLPAQVSAANPILVMLIIPFLLYVVFPAFEKRGIAVTPLRRMGVGMALTAFSFVLAAMVQGWIDDGQKPNVLWQLPQYIVLTIGEVLVSTTGLEFSYSQAPRRMKSTVMSLWNLQVSFGNVIAAMLVGSAALDASLFMVFAVAMAVFAAGFIVRARFYQYRDFPQQ